MILARLTLVPILLYSATILFCQTSDYFITGARNAAMAGAAITLPDIWAVRYNPAAIATLKSPQLAIEHQRRFTLNELANNNIAAFLPSKSGTFGLIYSRFGYINYNENWTGLTYSKQLSNSFLTGIGMSYYNIYNAASRSNEGMPIPMVSVQYYTDNTFQVALSMTNPFETAKNKNINYPAIYLLGIGYKLNKTFSANSCLYFRTNQHVVWTVGAECNINTNLYFRSGIAVGQTSFPDFNQFSFGLGYYLKNISIDFSFCQHPQLGYSPSISASYIFNKSTNK